MHCLFANDIDQMKAATYEASWTGSNFYKGDIAALQASNIPGFADLA
ncbi:hypothetical protein [Methylobacterium sp. CM6244]